MRKLRIVIAAALLTLGTFVIAAPAPAAASCSGLGVQVDDGSGHQYTFWTTGTCSNPNFGKSDLRYDFGMPTCIGNWNIDQGAMSDCLNWIRFIGPWPGNRIISTYRDEGFAGRQSGGPHYTCEHNAWYQLSHPDEITSFLVTSTSAGCT